MFQTKVVEKFKTHIFSENRAVYETMLKSIVEPVTSQMTLWRMRIACWITKATNTYSEHLILIALSLQQWLHYRASVLRYTYIACLVAKSKCWLYWGGAALMPLLMHVIYLDPPRSPISVLSQAVKLRPLVQEHQVGTGVSEYDANFSPVWDMS
jgi:hypothetical protein